MALIVSGMGFAKTMDREEMHLSFVAKVGEAVHKLLMIQAFRPDRLLAATHQVVHAVLGALFMQAAEQELNLAEIIENEVKASTPVLMCSVPGYDASGRVDDLAAELNKPITSIAIGHLTK